MPFPNTARLGYPLAKCLGCDHRSFNECIILPTVMARARSLTPLMRNAEMMCRQQATMVEAITARPDYGKCRDQGPPREPDLARFKAIEYETEFRQVHLSRGLGASNDQASPPWLLANASSFFRASCTRPLSLTSPLLDHLSPVPPRPWVLSLPMPRSLCLQVVASPLGEGVGPLIPAADPSCSEYSSSALAVFSRGF